jgi:hypothetical protein
MSGSHDQLLRTVRGVRCMAVPDQPGRWWYLPLAPIPVRAASGEPAVRLVELGDGAILQLETRLGPPDDELERVRRDLAEALRAESADAGEALAPAVRLDPAPITVDAVELCLDSDGGRDPLAVRAQPSGYPPQLALFNVTLDAAQRALAVSAMGGRSGLLTIAYRGLTLPSAPTRRTATSWSASSSTTTTIEERSCDGPAERATHSEHAAGATREVRVEPPATLPPLPDLVADVATWFADGRGLEHMVLAPGPPARDRRRANDPQRPNHIEPPNHEET